MYKRLSEKWVRTSEALYTNYFEIIDEKLYYIGEDSPSTKKEKPLTKKNGDLRMAGEIRNIGEIHYHKGEQNKWGEQIEFSGERNQFEKKQKWE